jgi:tetratricopeptide (TPR) repeat protein
VDKNQLSLLIQNFSALEKEEAFELIDLQKNFPYSQVIRNLATRAAQDADMEGKESFLHTSAIYSTDRAVLKSIMTAPRAVRTQSFAKSEVNEPEVFYQPPTIIHGKAEVPTLAVEQIVSTSPTVTMASSLNLYDQVATDLAAMLQSKKRFEETVAELERTSFKPLAEKTKIAIDIESVQEDGLIEEIKNLKRKTTIEPKQKEQIKIIDQFIKAQPSIPKAKPTAPTVDFTEKSVAYGDNIVSETLVEILLKQGKKEKAIEMLKKLIWKFPQKKAYFAAQIEDLKKSLK